MFGIMTGVIINVVAVSLGTAAGMTFKHKSVERIGERIFQTFGLFTIVIGVTGASDLSQTYLILASLIIGTILGEAVDLDKRLNGLGDFFQKKFAKDSENSSFSQGFIQASLLFCLGSMSIVGSFQSAMEKNHSVLITKSILDGVGALLLSAKLGIGVIMSTLTVLVYQGTLVLGAGFISPLLPEHIISVTAVVGNILLIGVGLNMLKVTNLKVANFLPSIFVPMVYQGILILLGK